MSFNNNFLEGRISWQRLLQNFGCNCLPWSQSSEVELQTKGKQTSWKWLQDFSLFKPIDKSPLSEHWPVMVPHFSTSETTGPSEENSASMEVF